MEIIDSHVHLSKFGHEGKSFAEVRDALLQDMKSSGVAHAVIFPDSEPTGVVAGLDECLELAEGNPALSVAGTVFVPAVGPDDLVKLRSLAATGKIVGLKLYPGFEVFYPIEERCHPLYEMCVEHSVPVVFHSGESLQLTERERLNHPYEIAKVAKRFPELKIVIAHFSQPHIFACRDVVLANPNVHVDISGLAHPEVIEACGLGQIRRVLRQVASCRPDKVTFGTDWPLCDVKLHIDLVISLPIPAADKQSIIGGNARRLFRLK
ncbi:MAG: amidohydrolase family protein [Bacillota bacterium]|nr:amidohydrolase family protein [Bacillota bacterium]